MAVAPLRSVPEHPFLGVVTAAEQQPDDAGRQPGQRLLREEKGRHVRRRKASLRERQRPTETGSYSTAAILATGERGGRSRHTDA